MSLAANLFDFRLPEARLRAFLVILVAALISPNIATPGSLPALRFEQIALAIFLPSLIWFLYQRPGERRLQAIDVAFAALAGAIALTLLVAPIIVGEVTRSTRDVFEIARAAEYWLLFRLGLTVVPDVRTWRATTGVFLGAAVGLTIFSLLQYLRPWDFNDTITTFFTTEHNLEGVERRGRVLGTTGNANYYGMFSGFLMVLALGVMLLRPQLGRWFVWLAPLAAFAAVLSIVMAQSRTATFAMLGAMFLGLLLVLWHRGRGPAYAQAIGVFLAAVVISVAFVEAVPPRFGSFHERFAPAALTQDSSVDIRFSKWRSVFSGFLESTPDFCLGETLDTRSIAAGHEIADDTGVEPAPEDAIERDEQRKEDVATIAAGIVDYFCAYDEWPAEIPLDEALVPEFLAELPADPATGEPYLHYLTPSGITVGAELENPADAEGPIYTLGTIPNFIINPSFASGGSQPSSWLTVGSGGEEDAEPAMISQGLFGETAVEVDFPPGGTFFQNVVYEFPQEEPYTAAAWLRSPTGEPQEAQIYLTAQTTDGGVIDPLARTVVDVPGDGQWVHASVTFETPAEGRIHILRYIVRTEHGGEPATVQIDGARLTRGTFPVSFHTVRNVNPASLTAADTVGFSDSPVVGVGPRRDQDFGSVDNEYVLFLENFGIVGTVAYLALWVTAFAAAWRAWRHGPPAAAIFAISTMVFIIGLALFNVTAGSYYHFQLMAVFWLVVGLLASAGRRVPEEEQPL